MVTAIKIENQSHYGPASFANIGQVDDDFVANTNSHFPRQLLIEQNSLLVHGIERAPGGELRFEDRGIRWNAANKNFIFAAGAAGAGDFRICSAKNPHFSILYIGAGFDQWNNFVNAL